MTSTPAPAVGHLIVGTPRLRSSEPGFLTRQIVTDLRHADGELWHGRQAQSLIILRVENVRTNDRGDAPASAPLPFAVARNDRLVLAYSRPLERLGPAHWTRICATETASGRDAAGRQLGQLAGTVVLARVTELHHVSRTGNQSWLWREDGTLVPQ